MKKMIREDSWTSKNLIGTDENKLWERLIGEGWSSAPFSSEEGWWSLFHYVWDDSFNMGRTDTIQVNYNPETGLIKCAVWGFYYD